ncbi:unnamed protein product [Gemmata massiliana]|uniref:Uncharacterized protein n=1 Tax=Gemmata massiliana TaxID=1210884 RepID=A0A6P2CYX1_9BACT|nr:unnamed protein product [Gemmata massiliana]
MGMPTDRATFPTCHLGEVLWRRMRENRYRRSAAEMCSGSRRMGGRIGTLSAERVEQILAGLRFLQATYFGGS